MNLIRIRKLIDSETLYLPELKPMVGKTVDIIVTVQSPEPMSSAREPDCFRALRPKEEFDPRGLAAMRPNLTPEQYEALAAIATKDLLDVGAIAELRAASMV